MLGRGAFPQRYFTHFTGRKRLSAGIRRVTGREKNKYMEAESVRHRRSDSLAMFDGPAFLGDFGFRPETHLGFFNHHRAHALPTLFHTDWAGGAALYGRWRRRQHAVFDAPLPRRRDRDPLWRR